MLILYGHTHADQALVFQNSAHCCLCLGSNASYTNDKNGYIGFQFIRVEFGGKGTQVRVWPYRHDERAGLFKADRNRWNAQQGRNYFDLDTFTQVSPGIEMQLPLSVPKIYKDWVKKFHSTTILFDQLASKGMAWPVQLEEVYIPLETNNPFYQPEQEDLPIGKSKRNLVVPDEDPVGEFFNQEPEMIDIETLIGRVECLLLRGKTGAGKTTLIKHLANVILKDAGPKPLSGYLPLLVFGKELGVVYHQNTTILKQVTAFEELLQVYLAKIQCPLEWDLIRNFLNQGRILLLIDGLDEIQETARPELAQILAQFCFKYPHNRLVLTSRPHGIVSQAQEQFGKYLSDIADLNENQIADFIKHWFRAVSGKLRGLAEITADDMLADIRRYEQIAIFTRNPLLLAAVSILYLTGKRIPEQRADLYDRVLENLLWWLFHNAAAPEKVNIITTYLMDLAFLAHSKRQRTIPENQARQELCKYYPQRHGETEELYLLRINELFNEIESNCGLLNRLSSGEVEFSHLAIQEFLAAKYIANRNLPVKEFIGNDWWEEPVILCLGYINLMLQKQSNDQIMDLLNTVNENPELDWKIQLIGANALRDFQGSRREAEAVELAKVKLLEMISSGANLIERFEAGEILGVLGDSRLMDDPEQNLILIPAGKFERGREEEKTASRYAKLSLMNIRSGSTR